MDGGREGGSKGRREGKRSLPVECVGEEVSVFSGTSLLVAVVSLIFYVFCCCCRCVYVYILLYLRSLITIFLH